MKKRISIGPGDVAGYLSRLKIGFDELGVPCEHFLIAPNVFSYQEGRYFLKKYFNITLTLRKSEVKIKRIIGVIAEKLLRLVVLYYAIGRYDVFIFTGYGSFFRFWELPILKLFKKRIIVIYVGSDARPPIFSGRHLDDVGAYVSCLTAYNEGRQIVSAIRWVERWADVIVNHTGTAQFFTRSFVRVLAVGTPIQMSEESQPRLSGEVRQRPVKILHAPTRPLAKGSPTFRRLIDELRNEGHSIEYIELIGVPNSKVLEHLQECDFVIDELYSDAPMAVLATEAAMYGKPVVVGGYYAEQFLIDNPDAESPPVLYVDPENIKDAIKTMVIDVDFRTTLGKKARKFILENRSARKVAENYLRLVSGDIPETWIADPESMSYYWGWGLSKEKWRSQVSSYVAKLGADALLLDHTARLKKSVLEEIQQGATTSLR